MGEEVSTLQRAHKAGVCGHEVRHRIAIARQDDAQRVAVILNLGKKRTQRLIGK